MRFDRVRKVFDNEVVALEEFSLEIPSPRLVVLVGPSGCGKTTLLRLIAGLERPTSGSIMLGDERLDALDARKRDVAMVFQNYALYPHMTVRENLSFGLHIRKADKELIRERVDGVSKSLEIHALLDRRPAQLSGGQRQRVALGRAVVREPKVFLFDEPLSNLDARLRDEMRFLIKQLYERLRTTTVYVTHDQVEAMTIGEMLVVLREGRIHQVGSPTDCYRVPRDTFVAAFLGSPPMNLLGATFDPGTRSVLLDNGSRFPAPAAMSGALERAGLRELTLGVRPEDMRAVQGEARSGELLLHGKVILRETLGHETLTHMRFGEHKIVARGPEALPVKPDGTSAVGVETEAIHFFAGRTGTRIDGKSAGTT
ncbi:MAG: ABC transporter ATP-binding protein [Candidatus Krumholzibacteriia bacterium]